jgi:hypothetical protein
LKSFLFFTLLLSSQAFAIDFNKVSGSFDVEAKNSKQENVTKFAYSAFGSKGEQGRVPASEKKLRIK